VHKRYPLAALAALGLAASAAPASAATTPEPTTPSAFEATEVPVHRAAGTNSIVLPTGDEIRLTADGSYLAEPVEDGEGAFNTAVEPDGDRLVIPVAALPGLGSGEYTFEQFNIDALARNGITEAGSAEARSLLTAEAEPEPADTVPVEFTGLWPDGSTTSDFTFLQWVNVDTNEVGRQTLDGDTGTLALAPGHYHLGTMLNSFNAAASIAGVIDLTVDADGGAVVFDGAAAVPIGMETDREAVVSGMELVIFSNVPGTEEGVSIGASAGRRWGVTVVPTSGDLAGREVGMSLRAELVSPADAEDPYSYSLYERHEHGIPADPVFRVRDSELARIEMDYQSLGADAQMRRSNLMTHTAHPAPGYLSNSLVDLPSERTEFYSAGADLTWSHVGRLQASSDGDEPPASADVLHYSGALEAGDKTKTTWNGGPVTVGVDLAGAEYYLPRFLRWESEGVLLTNPAMFSSGSPDEAVNNYNVPGQTVLSQNGLGINKSSEAGSLATDLALVPEGRYEVFAEGHRDVPWTPLGTTSTAEWSFTTAPAGDESPLDVAVVNFDAEDIENGYAEAGEDQDVELEYATQPGAEQRECTSMTFEVSYDDGKTWEEVEIDREGNRAEAELEHPEDAEFVSVRFTAADDAGNTVTHSTIRSYGLK
jgi:hypothetical protein